MVKLTVTYVNTQSLYYSHIIHITTINITVVVIFCGVSFYSFRCFNMGFGGRAEKES